MEENIDSEKETKNNEEPLKKSSPNDNVQKNQAKTVNINKSDNDLDPKKQIINTERINEIVGKKEVAGDSNDKKINPKKEIPIEKKPFNEFVNEHLLPSLILEFKERGFVVEDINLKNTFRPIAGDECWVIYCAIKDTCKFWLSFEKDDISSIKSISLCRFSQKPSVIESFLIDEKRITLKLIISRILQRLNGQKLIGIN